MQPPTGSAPITLTATRHKSTGNTSFQVESDFSQARMLASWGSSDYTIAVSGDKYLITAAGKVYTFSPGSVGIGVPLPTVVAEFEVMTSDNSPRPSSTIEQQYSVWNHSEVGWDGYRLFDNGGGDFQQLVVFAPDDEDPELGYYYSLWVDYFSPESEEPIAANTKSACIFQEASGDPLPTSAIWSFGNLLTYPSVPVIG